MTSNSTDRFSDRVDNYVRYRPSYPLDVLEILRRETSLTELSAIADVGSGTGISASLFLAQGNTVYGVEPNDEMRQAAEQLLSHEPHFYSVNGTAEDTTLASHSVDYVIAAQAFHWFDPVAAKQEFLRILKPEGWLVLLWNTRCIDSTPFAIGYENILKEFGTDYLSIRHRNISHHQRQDFLGSGFLSFNLENSQQFDFEGLKGRLLSSSYVPNETASIFPAMMQMLAQLFEAHQQDGVVTVEYDTQLYVGQGW